MQGKEDSSRGRLYDDITYNNVISGARLLTTKYLEFQHTQIKDISNHHSFVFARPPPSCCTAPLPASLSISSSGRPNSRRTSTVCSPGTSNPSPGLYAGSARAGVLERLGCGKGATSSFASTPASAGLSTGNVHASSSPSSNEHPAG